MVRNYKHIKNEELRDLIKMFCDAKNIRIKYLYNKNKEQLYDIIDKHFIMDWIIELQELQVASPPPSLTESGNITALTTPDYHKPHKPRKPLKLKRHYKPDRSNMPNISKDNIYISDIGTFKYLKYLNCFDNIQYVHIKQFTDDDIIEFKYKNEYDENFKKISTVYIGTIAGIGFYHKVNY
jgi:hypothetical protein